MSWHDFWTNENNPALPKSEYLYNTRHIFVLVSVAVVCVLLSLLFFKKSEKTKRILMLVLVSILFFFEIASRVVNLIITTDYSWQNITQIILPMHMCSVVVWILIFSIYTKKQFLYDFAVIGGFLATLVFLLYPAVGLNRVYMSFTCLYSTLSHSIGYISVILLMSLGFAKFEWKRIWQPFLCFAIMFGWGALLDFVIFPGADYMYLRNDPLELGLSIPYHIVYVGILIIYTSLFYVAYWIIKKIKNRQQKTP